MQKKPTSLDSEEIHNENIISDELRELLGDESIDSLVLSKSSKKKEKSSTPIIPETILETAVKLSKAAKKRQQQIELRKVKEEKRADYYTQLKQYEILDSHRELLRGTKSIGQTDTRRMAVSHLYKKYKLGLSLTAEEMELLFPHKDQDEEEDENERNMDKGMRLQTIMNMKDMNPMIDSNKTIMNTNSTTTQMKNNIHNNTYNNAHNDNNDDDNVKEIDNAPPVFTDLFAIMQPSDSADTVTVTTTDSTNKDVHIHTTTSMKKNKKRKSSIVPTTVTSNIDIITKNTPEYQISSSNNMNSVSNDTSLSNTNLKTTKIEEEDDDVKTKSSSIASSLLAQFHKFKSKLNTNNNKSIIEQQNADTDISTEICTEMIIDQVVNNNLGSKMDDDLSLPTSSHVESSPPTTTTSTTTNSHQASIYTPSEISLENIIREDGVVQPLLSETTTVSNVQFMKRHILPHTSADNDSTRTNDLSRKTIPLFRSPTIQASRMSLPICSMEQEIVEAIHENDVIILCGETGSGKSTQIPQFLYEAGYTQYGLIVTTQPRRIAAISTAQRVAYELSNGTIKEIIQTDSTSISNHKKSSKVTVDTNYTESSSISNKRSKHSSNNHNDTSTNTNTSSTSSVCIHHHYGRLKPLVTSSSSSSSSSLSSLYRKRKHDNDHNHHNNSIQNGTHTNDKKISEVSYSAISTHLIGYQIRFDSSTIKPETKIIFMTDGILLKEITSDLLLRKYSVVILDEAHERSVNTDILLGMISRTIEIRKQQSHQEMSLWNTLSDSDKLQYEKPLQPLKLIIMSATLKISDFQNKTLFPLKLPPIITVEARQYPVTVHFAKRTELQNYIQETYKKVVQIHQRLPPGGVLVFLTGKREIQYMCHKLKKKLLKKKRSLFSHINASMNNSNNEENEENVDIIYDLDHPSANNSNTLDDSDDDDDDDSIMSHLNDVNYDSENEENEEDDNTDVEVEGENEYQDTEINTSDKNNNDNNSTSHQQNDIISHSNKQTKRSVVSLSDKDTKEVKDNQSEKEITGNKDSSSTEGEDIRAQMLRSALGFDINDKKDEAINQSNNETMNTSQESETQASSNDESTTTTTSYLKPIILPLYAMLSQKQQQQIFQEIPDNCRLIVIATNVAETSITIPGIRYVVDCGRQKERVRLMPSGISKFEVKFISQMSAEQRKGRAGRTGPGHCYRLYSSAFYEQSLPQFTPPAILSTPLEDLILQMKSIGIQDILAFPLPTPPSWYMIKKAQELLIYLGALELSEKSKKALNNSLDMMDYINTKQKQYKQLKASTNTTKEIPPLDIQFEIDRYISKQQSSNHITAIGQLMSLFPIHPRFSKMLIIAYQTIKSTLSTCTTSTQKNNSIIMTTHTNTDDDITNSIQIHVDHEIIQSRLLHFILSLVCVMAEKSPFIHKYENNMTEETDNNNDEDKDASSDDETSEKDKKMTKKTLNLSYHPYGDSLARLYAFSAFAYTYYQTKRTLQYSHTTTTTTLSNSRTKKKNSKKASMSSTLSENKTDRDNGYLQAVEEFCMTHQLHIQTLKRSLDLREQLYHVFIKVFCAHFSTHNHHHSADSSIHVHHDEIEHRAEYTTEWANMKPPTKEEELSIRQIMLSGYNDCIAKRVSAHTIKEGSRRKRLTAYITCDQSIKEPIYIHPYSSLYEKDPTADLPEYIVYDALIQNTRGDYTYMTNVNTINVSWIPYILKSCPLLKLSSPLMSPTPYYDVSTDTIMSYTIPKYGPHNWELPVIKYSLYELTQLTTNESSHSSNSTSQVTLSYMKNIGYRKEDEVYRWFARLLLEGHIFSHKSEYVLKSMLKEDHMKDPPACITQMKPIAKVSNIVSPIVKYQVYSKQKLKDILKGNKQFLTEEIQEFLKVEYRSKFRVAWANFASS